MNEHSKQASVLHPLFLEKLPQKCVPSRDARFEPIPCNAMTTEQSFGRVGPAFKRYIFIVGASVQSSGVLDFCCPCPFTPRMLGGGERGGKNLGGGGGKGGRVGGCGRGGGAGGWLDPSEWNDRWTPVRSSVFDQVSFGPTFQQGRFGQCMNETVLDGTCFRAIVCWL